MLTEVELKEKLIAKINDTDDVELLHQISLLIDFEEKSEDVYVLSPEEREAVLDGISQIESGRWISHEEANKRIDEWLKK